jgi:hypothetical protein
MVLIASHVTKLKAITKVVSNVLSGQLLILKYFFLFVQSVGDGGGHGERNVSVLRLHHVGNDRLRRVRQSG